ncbi:MAG TPA: GNAT family N-acetyltransferase [Candidatus Alectryocaccomicrobium excrementavium]|uniref:GNAT family N-acetyltransferase n=1 Tax=Candidatus Alectryocaccomicrobium excrementavium TaxID=2840668 RepID=A0A9D1FYB1_9FIRM|nr:GNAT family N-acetyltransferase [Candidatus Alectryocaccomicrobium excrementavium]
MVLVQYFRECLDAQMAAQILALEETAWPADGENAPFPPAPETYVTSFVLLDDGRAICHVGIRKSSLSHKEQTYLAYGLSEVVTHPQYQNQGLGSKMLKVARQFILDHRPDISIFTCAPERVSFYTRGGWQAVPGACFVGGTPEKPFRSDALGLITMMMFCSGKAKQHRSEFENADIVFSLGENQLW